MQHRLDDIGENAKGCEGDAVGFHRRRRLSARTSKTGPRLATAQAVFFIA